MEILRSSNYFYTNRTIFIGAYIPADYRPDKVPSVRELAAKLAVNQNTILKVYNELCRQNVLKIERGDGTYVSSNRQTIPAAERRKTVSNVLREAAILTVQLELPIEQVVELLQKEFENIVSQRADHRRAGTSEK